MKFFLKIITLVGFGAICWLLLTAYSFRYKPNTDGPIKTLVIDPGHGGREPGAVSKNYREKDLTLAIALELKKFVAANMPEVDIVMTRDDDRFVGLFDRARIAQDNGGDFFVSIHCNSVVQSFVKGTETYVMGINEGKENLETVVAENEAILLEEDYEDLYGGFDPKSPEGLIYFRLLKIAFRQESTMMATKIQQEFRNRLKRIDRGVKQGAFVVLYLSGMPAVITEVGFISNKDEEAYLASKKGQKEIAFSIFKGIKAYNQSFEAEVESFK